MAAKHAASEFTATKFSTAEDKAKGVNALLAFVDAGFPESKFTKVVYDALYLHMFGHIAHYNRAGFYDEWFSDGEAQRNWMGYAANGGAYGINGDPAFTWCDAERVVQEEIRARLADASGY